MQRDTTGQLSTHIHTPQHLSIFPCGECPGHPSPSPLLFNGPQQVPATWQCGDGSWEHPAGAGVPATLHPPHPTHTQPGLLAVPPWVCCVCQTPISFHFKLPTLSPAEKKELLKGTPRICLPEGKEQPVAQRWCTLGRCVKPLHPHHLTWGPGENRESQGGRRRHYEEGGPQGRSCRVSMPHTARNSCLRPRGVCCKEIEPGVCYKGQDLEGPLPSWGRASLWGRSRRWVLEEGARAKPRPRRHLLGRRDTGDLLPCSASPLLPVQLFTTHKGSP